MADDERLIDHPGIPAFADRLLARLEDMRVQRDEAQDERAALRRALVDASIWLPYPSPIWDMVNDALNGTVPAVAHV